MLDPFAFIGTDGAIAIVLVAGILAFLFTWVGPGDPPR